MVLLSNGSFKIRPQIFKCLPSKLTSLPRFASGKKWQLWLGHEWHRGFSLRCCVTRAITQPSGDIYLVKDFGGLLQITARKLSTLATALWMILWQILQPQSSLPMTPALAYVLTHERLWVRTTQLSHHQILYP